GSITPSARGAAAESLRRFDRVDSAFADLDLRARYGGRSELLSPKRALPTWHRHARSDAAAVFAAIQTCGIGPVPMRVRGRLETPPVVQDAELLKAVAWQRARCRGDDVTTAAMVDEPPLLHPSGRSYARLALETAPRPDDAWIRAHKASFH